MHPATWRTLFQDVVGDREALAAQRNVQSEANQLIARRLLTDGGPLAGIEAEAIARLEDIGNRGRAAGSRPASGWPRTCTAA